MSGWLQSLNVLVSAVWTAIFVVPVYLFCDRNVHGLQLYAFLTAGILAWFLPRRVIQRLQLSEGLHRYRGLHVPVLARVTQDAGWLRRFTSSAPRVGRDQATLQQMIRDTWMRERFHLGLAVFYTLCSLLAVWRLQIAWFLFLIFANLFYNLYPMWLQQYLRLRIEPLLRR